MNSYMTSLVMKERRSVPWAMIIRLMMLAALVGGIVFIIQGKDYTKKEHALTVDEELKPYGKTLDSGPPIPTLNVPIVSIADGLVQHPEKLGLAPLEVITQAGTNYFLKLVDVEGRTVLSAYITGGQPFETKVPLGRYEIRYAYGQNWYGLEHYFGQETTKYSKADTWFEFTSDSQGYSGYTV